MTLEYSFDTIDEFGRQRWYDYDYEVEDRKLKEGLIRVLCKKCKRQIGSLYNEDGAYQMVNCIVYSVNDIESFAENYRRELEDEFIDVAEKEFNATREEWEI